MFRNILVHVKPLETSSPHEATAVAIAKAHGARLTGIATLRDVSMLKLLFPTESATSAARIERSYALAAAAERAPERHRKYVGVPASTPAATSSRNCWISTFSLMPVTSRRRSPKRRGPGRRWYRMIGFHLPPITASATSRPQSVSSLPTSKSHH